MHTFAANLTSRGAAACSECTREAFFQARIESPAGRWHTRWHTRRRANACSSHLVEVIQTLCAWAQDNHLAAGCLTVLAIDPYSLPRLAVLGVTDEGFAFYSAPITRPGAAARREEAIHHG
jgi:hypothetical protein